MRDRLEDCVQALRFCAYGKCVGGKRRRQRVPFASILHCYLALPHKQVRPHASRNEHALRRAGITCSRRMRLRVFCRQLSSCWTHVLNKSSSHRSSGMTMVSSRSRRALELTRTKLEPVENPLRAQTTHASRRRRSPMYRNADTCTHEFGKSYVSVLIISVHR